ncbi:MAG: extracellular solute-binding protein [Clostridia bacterium]
MKKVLALVLTSILLMSCLVSASAEAPYDWKKYEGTTIQVAFVEHTTSNAIISKIPDFEALTGIKVETSVTPEANHFDKVNAALSSRSGSIDLFMSGAYQLWDYSAAGYVEDLTPYLADVAPDYDAEDLVKSAMDALKWDGVPGHPVGSGAQLGLPLCFELYSLGYNKRAFEEKGLEIPHTYDELLTVCEALKEWNGPGSYAIALRGARDWGTIHPGYMSTFANFGAKDFEVVDNKLVSRLDSPESIAMTEFWVKLIEIGGAPSWSKYTWYEAGADLGAGKAAMLFDADNNSITQNWIKDGIPASAEAGNIAWTVMPVAKVGDTPNSNYWTWSMAMNANSDAKNAAWYFLQYFTNKDFSTYASITEYNMDPIRTSVWEDPAFIAKMEQHEGYIDTFNKTIGSTSILFTPQPEFFVTTTEWAATLQDIVMGQYKSVEEAMKTLAGKVNEAVSYIDLSDYAA